MQYRILLLIFAYDMDTGHRPVLLKESEGVKRLIATTREYYRGLNPGGK
jgi:hypothetical protein